MEVRAGDDNANAIYHVDDTNIADKAVWIKRNEDTSVADGAPPPFVAANSLSLSLSVAVRSIALLSETCCLWRKAQHEAPDAEMVARGGIDDIARFFYYCPVQAPAYLRMLLPLQADWNQSELHDVGIPSFVLFGDFE